MSDTKTKVQRNGQDTSWDAALLQTPYKSQLLYRRIYTALLFEPRTDEELLENLRDAYPDDRFTDSGVRSRRNELVLAGWVTKDRDEESAVVKRIGSNGSPRIVWRSVRDGEHVDIPTDNGQRVAAPAIDHEAGLAAAERWMRWETGTNLASHVIDAYLNPAKTHAELDADGAPQ